MDQVIKRVEGIVMERELGGHGGSCGNVLRSAEGIPVRYVTWEGLLDHSLQVGC